MLRQSKISRVEHMVLDVVAKGTERRQDGWKKATLDQCCDVLKDEFRWSLGSQVRQYMVEESSTRIAATFPLAHCTPAGTWKTSHIQINVRNFAMVSLGDIGVKVRWGVVGKEYSGRILVNFTGKNVVNGGRKSEEW